MYRIVQKKYLWFTLSGLLLIPGAIFLVLGGLKPNIDFTGGTMWQLKFAANRPTVQELETKLKELGLNNLTVQPVGDQGVTIRSQAIDNEKRVQLLQSIQETYPGLAEEAYETVGPTIGKELKQRAVTAVILVMLGIIFYITFAFRKISKATIIPSWVMGLAAIIALAHDMLFMLGLYAFLGYFYQVEVGALFITALLTILGFSVHDTIVVFDRIREHMLHGSGQDFETIINDSVNQTIARSLNTSLTTIFVLTALYLFGGESIRWFVFAMIVGIIAGTYSSIFIASPLLVIWQKIKSRKRS
ncbi:MAG: protein translocase subunit SecF [Patescibacteria group bacterium]|nr:protein translocase subunit SecF [Patescibacteria group bacterium]